MDLEERISIMGPQCLNNVKRLVFGVNASKTIGLEIKRLIGKRAKVFLVTDKGIKKAGLVDKISSIVEKEGFELEVYDKNEAEPTIESARKITNAVREDTYDVVIGVGGGSALDAAKIAAIMYTNPGDISNYLSYTEDLVKNKPLPKILVPTTSGTGSEVTPYVVVISENNIKNFITSPFAVADVAIVDPLMTITCPPKQTAASGMDALSHALEAILSLRSTPISDAYAFSAVKLVSDNLRRAYHWGQNLEARYNMSLAATLSGIAISTPAVIVIGHCIAEILGPLYGIPHGVICGITAPYMMEYNLPARTEKLALIASHLGEDTCGLSVREAAQKAIKAVRTLVEDVELPKSLKEVNIPRTDIQKIAKLIIKEQEHWFLPDLNPRKLTMENVTALIEKMWEGES